MKKCDLCNKKLDLRHDINVHESLNKYDVRMCTNCADKARKGNIEYFKNLE
jgi:hypothetical protein